METGIYYFSGTGNALVTAREIGARLGKSSLKGMLDLMDIEQMELPEERIGLVFPIYAFTMPDPVREFIKRAKLNNAKQIFAVAVRMRSPSNVFNEIDALLKEKALKLDNGIFINMLNNYIMSYPPPGEKEVEQLNRKMRRRVDILCGRLEKGSSHIERAPGGFRYRVLQPLLTFLAAITGYLGLANRFYADDRCTGCGECSRICLAERINMLPEGPSWNRSKRCYYCLACLHFCNEEAIQVRGSKTNIFKRCRHPEVGVADIVKQK